MRRRLVHTSVIVVLIGTLTAAAPRAEAATSFTIANCNDDTQPGHVISTPGTYVLERAVSFCTSDPVIQVTASDVTLDLNGYLVDGVDDTDIGVSVASAATGVVVRNGTLSDFSIAVHLDGTGNSASGLTAQSNDIGINAAGDDPLISGNTVVGNDDIGILLSSGTDRYAVKRNTVARNAVRGIQAVSGSDGVFESNVVAANGGDGIAVVQSGSGNTFFGNRVIGNAGDGIHAEPVNISASVIRSNVATGNGGDGIEAGSFGSIIENKVTGNGARGIAAGNSGNAIKRNVVKGNLGDGIFVGTPDAQTAIKDNKTTGNGLEGINASPFPGAGSGTNAAWANGTGHIGLGGSGGTFECTPETICRRAKPRAIAKKKVKPVEIDCGASPGLVINKPGRYLLTRAVVDCDAQPAVSIDASKVSFSLGGAVVDWDFGGGVPGVEVLAGRTGVSVKNGTLSDYEYAVEFAGTRSLAQSLIARSTNAGILGGTGNSFRGNTITRSGNTGLNAHDGEIVGNVIAGNALGGSVGGVNASGGVVKKNLVIGNARHGIDADDAVVASNRAIGNAWQGISVNSDNAVEGNVVTGNGGHGIRAGNPDNVIRGNTVTGNGGDPTFGTNGIRASDGGNKLVGNVVRGSSASGIFIDTPISQTTTIKENHAHGNGGFGINAAPFTGAGLGTNVAHGNVQTAECDPTTLCN